MYDSSSVPVTHTSPSKTAAMVRTSRWTQDMTQITKDPAENLFEVLGVANTATETEIRRAFKTLITKEHPDKGGSPERFKLIKLAYDTLSNKSKREHYSRTGKVRRTAAEEFAEAFRGGRFGGYADRPQEKENLAEALTVLQKPDHSHTAGFEAWLRSRGDAGTTVVTAESMAEQYGVNRGSYDPVALPQLQVTKAVWQAKGPLTSAVKVCNERLPTELEWGQVLIAFKYAPINISDAQPLENWGGKSRLSAARSAMVAGQQGIGIVTKIGPGVKGLREGEWVTPLKSSVGTWQNLAVTKASDVLVIPLECMPLEYAAVSQQLCLAYRLLEDFGQLKPGDCVILNAGTSTVGQALVQLCFALQLRSVALVSDHGFFEKTALWLKSLGATHVIPDMGSIKVELEKLRFFARPKLALDAVGGSASQRIAETLVEGGQLVVYGCLSEEAPSWPWQAWVHNGLQVQGINYAVWMTKNVSKLHRMMEIIGQLIKADQLRIGFTEYELASEFEEAVEHAMDRGTNTKVLLKMPDADVDASAV